MSSVFRVRNLIQNKEEKEEEKRTYKKYVIFEIEEKRKKKKKQIRTNSSHFRFRCEVDNKDKQPHRSRFQTKMHIHPTMLDQQ